MKEQRDQRRKSVEVADQVRLLHQLVRNQYYLLHRSDTEALMRGLRQYEDLRGLDHPKNIEPEIMRAFLYWMQQKSGLYQKDLGNRVGMSQPYVSNVLNLSRTENPLPPSEHETWIEALKDDFEVARGFDWIRFRSHLEKGLDKPSSKRRTA